MGGLRSDVGLEDILPSISFGLLIRLYVAFNLLSAADIVLDAVKRFRRPHIYLIFIGSCNVIYSSSTTNKMHLLSQIIY